MAVKGHQVSSATPPPHFRTYGQGLLLHLDWLDWLTNEFHGSTCSCLPRAGVTGGDQAPGLLCDWWESEEGPYAYAKHFTK